MLRIQVSSSTATAKTVDLDIYEDTAVNINLVQEEIRDLGKSRGSYTQTFRIPMTATNTEFFGGIVDASSTEFSYHEMRKRIPTKLFDDDVLMYEGFCQIKKVYRSKGIISECELAFFTESLDFIKALGDTKLSDLDFSFYNHTIDYTNYDTYIGATGGSLHNYVRYQPSERSKVYNSFQEWSQNGSGTWDLGDFTPWFNMSVLLNMIVGKAGYSFGISAWRSSIHLSNLWMCFYNGYDKIGSAQTDDYSMSVFHSPDQTMSNDEVVFFSVSGTESFDENGSQWDDATETFTCQLTGTYGFQLKTLIIASLTSNNVSGRVQLILQARETSGDSWQDIPSVWEHTQETECDAYGCFGTLTNYDQTFTRDDNILIYMKAGYQFRMIGKKIGNVDNFQVKTGSRITLTSFIPAGQVVKLENLAPDIRCRDVVLSLQKMFNLVFDAYIDDEGQKRIKMKSWNDYMDEGTTKDWSDKVDYDKDIVLSDMADEQARTYEWSHQVGKDFLSTALSGGTKRAYGRKLIEDAENEFATGENLIETSFAPFISSYIPGTNIEVARLMDEGGNKLRSPKARVAYADGTMPGNYRVSDGDGGYNVVNQFAVFKDYFEQDLVNLTVTATTNFGFEQRFTTPAQTTSLYNEFWSRRHLEKFGVEARKMEVYLNLTKNDVREFDFHDQIFCEGTYWRVQEIQQYPLNQEGSCKVIMTKILEEIVPCEYDISIVGSLVLFVGATGADYEACCNYYGYQWNGEFCQAPVVSGPPPVTGTIDWQEEEAEDDFAFIFENNAQDPVFRSKEQSAVGNGGVYIPKGKLDLRANALETAQPQLHIYQANANDTQSTVSSGLKAHPTATSSILFTLPGKLSSKPHPIVVDSAGLMTISDVQFRKVTSVTLNGGANTYSVLATDSVILAGYTGGKNGTWELYLPTVTNNEGRVVTVMTNGTITANKNVSVEPNTSDTGVTIDGNASHTLDRAYDGVELICISGQWYIRQRKSK